MIENILPEDFSQLFEIEQAAHLVPWSEGTLRNNQGDKYLNLKWQAQGEILAFANKYWMKQRYLTLPFIRKHREKALASNCSVA